MTEIEETAHRILALLDKQRETLNKMMTTLDEVQKEIHEAKRVLCQ